MSYNLTSSKRTKWLLSTVQNFENEAGDVDANRAGGLSRDQDFRGTGMKQARFQIPMSEIAP